MPVDSPDFRIASRLFLFLWDKMIIDLKKFSSGAGKTYPINIKTIKKNSF